MIPVSKDSPPDLQQLPKSPGVYFFSNAQGEIIYIGKAKSLRDRVRNYFSNSKEHSVKTKVLVSHIAGIEFMVVDNEVEALLLENNLIKKHSPKYNINLKDSKTYAYIKITAEEFPRVISTRRVTKDGEYFGPYTDGTLRHALVNAVISIFKLRTCQILPKKRACLNYHIGLCLGPCIGAISAEAYKSYVDEAREFLKGNTEPTVKKLTAEMHAASKVLHFERALELRNQLSAVQLLEERQSVEKIRAFDQQAIAFVRLGTKAVFDILTITKGVIRGKREYVLEYDSNIFEDFLRSYYAQHPLPYEILLNKPCWKTDEEKKVLEAYFERLRGGSVLLSVPQRGDKTSLVHLAEKNALASFGQDSSLVQIQENLNLPDVPEHIECFDISNLGYDHIVGSMTHFSNGKPDKSQYRKFRIKSLHGKQDDFASMAEIVQRRYAKLLEDHETLPNLIIIDGGKGQLNAALSSLRALGTKIPIISLAKEHEEIYFPGEEVSRKFEKNGPMMLLIRRIRDETHRFTIGYNRKRREMRMREEFKAQKH